MADPTGKRVTVVHFEKPLDRSKTVPELAAPLPRDTLPELAASREEQRPKGRRTVTLEMEAPEGLPEGGGGPAAVSREQLAELSVFGHRLFEQGKLPEARSVFERLVELGPDDPFPHTMLGIVYFAQGDPARALALFEAALALDPEDGAARVYRAEIRLGNGKVRQALEELGRIVKERPEGDPFAQRARKLIERSGAASSRRRRR